MYPQTIPSANLITPKGYVALISGTAQIATITPITDSIHTIVLIFTNAAPGTLLTSGNIALGVTPIQNAALLLTYNPNDNKYYPIAVGSGGGNPFDQDLNTTDDVEFASVTTPLIESIDNEALSLEARYDDGLGVVINKFIRFNQSSQGTIESNVTDLLDDVEQSVTNSRVLVGQFSVDVVADANLLEFDLKPDQSSIYSYFETGLEFGETQLTLSNTLDPYPPYISLFVSDDDGDAELAVYALLIEATVPIKAAGYQSSDGTEGVTAGPFTAITGITVKNGLVTALTGT